MEFEIELILIGFYNSNTSSWHTNLFRDELINAVYLLKYLPTQVSENQ